VYIKKDHFTTNTQTNKPTDEKLIKYILKTHIEETNLDTYNKNTYIPSNVLAYNLNSTDEYNILNNYGIKNQKKRNLYNIKNNNCKTLPYNKIQLFNNYDSVLDDSFTTIYLNNQHNECKKENLTKIHLIGNKNTFQWSYETLHLKNKNFYLFYKIRDEKCPTKLLNYNVLKITSNFESPEFLLSINNYKNRNIYIMNFLVKNKFCDIYIVLTEKNNMLIKSNNIIIEN
tara:strand:+ start:71 stop:757 length:687 start_codon:yes stop_codon:yes gene_type:complete